MRNFAIFVDGLSELEAKDLTLAETRLNAVRAINKIVPQARARAAGLIRAQVNFPAGYLTPQGNRLYVSSLARRDKLEGVISARSRPTSLARFISSYVPGKEGVKVEVEPGRSVLMKRAFVVQLPAGRSVDTKSNKGLAVRVGKGNVLRNKRTAVRLDSGLYLLYGPSVDQVFLNATGANAGKGVATDPVFTNEILDNLQTEFLRLMDL